MRPGRLSPERVAGAASARGEGGEGAGAPIGDEQIALHPGVKAEVGRVKVAIGIVAEDRRFLDFVRAAVEKLAASRGCRPDFVAARTTNGCSHKRLTPLVDRAGKESRLVVVGADCMGPTHATAKRLTHRQKASLLREVLSREGIPKPVEVSVAAAWPSVEAWLMADPEALAAGLSSELGIRFRPPPTWPSPSTESEAKFDLGRLIAEGVGSPLTRYGFEYAREIVGRADLLNSASLSLREWSVDLDSRLRRIVDGGPR